MENTKTLPELIIENPTLPVIPMVEADVVGDDYGYWMGEWGSCSITEYYVGRERIHFRNDDEEDVLSDMVGCKPGCDTNGNDIYAMSIKEWEKLYEALPWIKCIAVYINA